MPARMSGGRDTSGVKTDQQVKEMMMKSFIMKDGIIIESRINEPPVPADTLEL